jgi:hypothetical protein
MKTKMKSSNYEHLMSNCGAICYNDQCAEMVKQAPTGRWYITMGHCGFNSFDNNHNGYETSTDARIMSVWFSKRKD